MGSATRKLEAICDAVAAYHHYSEPESEAYGLRNPGLLLGDNGKRVFSCHRAGYAALLDRVQKHCRMYPDEKLPLLLEHFGIKMRAQQENALDFMGRCANATLGPTTNLKWFLEDSDGHTTAASAR